MDKISPNETDRKYMMLGLRIAGDFGATIAVPVILFVFIGQYLDEKYATGWKFTVAAFIFAALLSAKMILKKGRAYGEKYNNIEKER